MPTRPEHELAAPLPDVAPQRMTAPAGLLAVTIGCERAPSAVVVGACDGTTLRRVRQEALTMRARHARRVTVEVRFVDTPGARMLLATLDDLTAHDIHVVPLPIPTRSQPLADALATLRPSPAPPEDAPGTVEPLARGLVTPDERPLEVPPPSTPTRDDVAASREPPLAMSVAAPPAHPEPADAGAPISDAAPATAATAPPGPDPFDLDPEFRRAWLRPLRFLFDRYWRIEVSGLEHVPDTGPGIVAANHSGAIPADAFMLALALELRQPPRCLRVLYDRFVDALPVIGPLYRRLGAFPASLANGEMMLRRGEFVGLFPEGIAGVEKRFTERYRLRPFKTGAARLAVRTGAPIVPVAIVGAEEAYPVVARLYRVGNVVGLPWIPITPTFPLCGVAGAVPLPSKWRMHFCPPLVPPPDDGRPEEERVVELTARLRDALTTGVADLLAKRRGIFV